MQATIESAIGHELTVKWNLTLLVNAISVEIPYKDIVIIRRIPGVKSVELENIYAAPDPVDGDQPMTENTSSGMVGAQAAWADGYTGAGSIVAILDTGVDTTHQSFNGDAFNHAITETGKTIDLLDQTDIAGMQLNATGTYVSAKIPFAYNYADHNSNYGNDVGYQSNHGSHVAGIAAANRFIKNGSSYDDALTTVHAVGMAPDAQILAMKVFGSSGGAGYVIYRRAWSSTTNGWTAFDRWYNTTETTWIDGTVTKVYAGTRYQYGVKAYFAEKTDDIAGQTIGGAMDNYNLGIVSPLKTTVRITTRKLNSVTSADGKLTVKWSGSKVFTGYQVQIATDEGFTNVVKNDIIDVASTYSKVYDGLTSGTTYYVRIRSYHVFNGMTYYGEWSNVKNATLN